MSYCTNCGYNSEKNICVNCGVKNNKKHNYCYFCGNNLDPNATICPQCKESIKTPKKSIILDIILLTISLFFFIIFVVMDSNFNYSGYEINLKKTIFFSILSVILALPLFKNLIRKKFYYKHSLKRILNVTRYILIVTLSIISFAVFPIDTVESLNEANSVPVFSEKDAVDAAINAFHDTIKLKNEDSFVINNTQVIEGPADENGIEKIFVKIDYSAQNGFGGYNRENKTIVLEYNTESGEYTYSGIMY